MTLEDKKAETKELKAAAEGKAAEVKATAEKIEHREDSEAKIVAAEKLAAEK